MMIVDANDMIIGRMSGFLAKKALLGEEIAVVNSEKAVITGSKKNILADYKQARERGAPLVGPYIIRTPEAIVKRIIRGMLPYKRPRGREAFARIKCYRGIPKEFEGKKILKLEQFDVNNTNSKYITINHISKFLGAKV